MTKTTDLKPPLVQYTKIRIQGLVGSISHPFSLRTNLWCMSCTITNRLLIGLPVPYFVQSSYYDLTCVSVNIVQGDSPCT